MNRNDLRELIANGENSGVEFKLDTVRPEQLAKEVVALANLKGGHILLGVADDGTIVGITRENLGEWMADTVFARYVHPLLLPYYEEMRMEDGKIVVVLTIEQGISKPYVVRANDRETAYVRIGPVSRQATREQLLMLGSASGFLHTESMPVHRTNLESLDRSRLENYLKDILNDPDLPVTEEAWLTRLMALGLMTDGPAGGEPVCSIAGLVLFGIRPRQTLRQSGVRLIFFSSLEKTYQAQVDKILDAPLVGRFQVGKTGKTLIDSGLIEKTLELMEPFVTQEAATLDAHFRRDKAWLFPFEALRELIVNALAHRDWTRFVEVEIVGYQDRLEITSPGSLPNSMTVEKMLAGQRVARNPIIVEVLRDYGYVDARGMGIRAKVVPALKAIGSTWQVQATDDFVRASVGKAAMGQPMEPARSTAARPLARKSRERVGKESGKLLALCREKPAITIPELAAVLGISERSVQRNLQHLQREGLLRRVGGRKEGQWEVMNENT
ncbi:MAG: transcriptional regulator [Deltaproteobacteria bacterium RIFOXYA12_FULL_61_11]|nr:MAG: transcriptional regulator [Deltaproteobacteria bacterium RIFOXYA12_FULL_61_11]